MMLCIVLNTGIGVQSGIHSQDIRRSLTTNFLYHSLSVAGIKSLNDETISSWISGSRDPRARVSVFPISSLCIGSPGPKVYFSWIIFWTVSGLNVGHVCRKYLTSSTTLWHDTTSSGIRRSSSTKLGPLTKTIQRSMAGILNTPSLYYHLLG